MTSADRMLVAAGDLSAALAGFHCGGEVTHVYNPLVYARRPHETYLRRFGMGQTRPFHGNEPRTLGMAQTGVPFGRLAVRELDGD